MTRLSVCILLLLGCSSHGPRDAKAELERLGLRVARCEARSSAVSSCTAYRDGRGEVWVCNQKPGEDATCTLDFY